MKAIATLLALGFLALSDTGAAPAATCSPPWTACSPALSFEKRRLAGNEVVSLCDAYQRKVVLIVNTASKCAFKSFFIASSRLGCSCDAALADPDHGEGINPPKPHC